MITRAMAQATATKMAQATTANKAQATTATKSEQKNMREAAMILLTLRRHDMA